MDSVIRSVEHAFATLPLPLLEIWGRFGYLLGFALMVCAFGRVTLRPGGHWGLGRERQTWNGKALLSCALTFALIFVTGYIGSHIVLVPGAQTFESLKDLSVFLCILLFGYPALLTVPFAYGLSDLIEGVPPSYLLDWLPGYFINPACFWIAYQLIGKNPDFRRLRTWASYLLFVVVFMAIEPQLWGYICADKFTPEISYRSITPALFFTTSITWILAPPAMLAALPLARRFGMFWAEIPLHARERRVGQREPVWRSGAPPLPSLLPSAGSASGDHGGLPIVAALTGPLIGLVLLMVGATAYQTLSAAGAGADKLASRLHQEISENINLRLDDYLERNQGVDVSIRSQACSRMLSQLPIARHGRALVITRSGEVVASSLGPQPAGEVDDPVQKLAINKLLEELRAGTITLDDWEQYHFDVVTAKPLARETWLAQATPYQDRAETQDWVLLTLLPATYYLEAIRTGNSQSAMVSAGALLVSLLVAGLLASIVTTPIRRVSRAAEALATGEPGLRVPRSRVNELDALSNSFNEMAEQLARRTERLRLATRAGHLGIWDWNVVDDRLVWDDTMHVLYGVDRQEFSGTFEAWASTLHPDDSQRARDDVKAALEGVHDFDSEFRVPLPDGSIRSLRGVATVIRDQAGHPLRMVGINYDISERKKAEQELLRHRDHLETLVAERTVALSVAVAQAEAATLAKSDFLANMSHEIRTPMNAIFGMTELALRTDLSEKQKDYLNNTRLAADTLLGLIDDVLDFSKIEAGKLEIAAQEFILMDVFKRVTAMIAHRAQQKGLNFHINVAPDVPRALIGDEQRLVQVLSNLSQNAVKFTSEGEVAVTVKVVTTDSDRVTLRFAVRDTGIGMDDARLMRLFKPFSQADASITRKYGGTGLGLVICKRLVGMMGGDIVVSSELGKGSEFSFTADFSGVSDIEALLGAPLAEEPKGGAPLRAPLRKGLRVLLVEDNEINQMVAVELLTIVAGAKVVVAANGQEALDLLNQQPFDIVLTDLQMPVMDGFALTLAIRNDPALSGLPIIAVTADALLRDRERGLAMGMNDYITKPFDPKQLAATLSRWV